MYKIQKEAHSTEDRNRGYQTGDCKFRVNAYRQKKDDLIHITKVKGEHNHEIVDNIRMAAP